MAESISIEANTDKETAYRQLLPQIKALIGNERNATAVMANTAAALHHAFSFLWTGFYIVDETRLVLGAFQGPVACMEIAHGKGVCGQAWKENRTQVVPDVDQFPGHIACSSLSKSEIVIPVRNSAAEVVAVLDIDSAQLGTFDAIDARCLEELCNWIGEQAF